MTFQTAFLWGTGISLGMTVGLFVWGLLRPLVTSKEWQKHHEANERSVAALELRNLLTEDTNELLERIADALEKK